MSPLLWKSTHYGLESISYQVYFSYLINIEQRHKASWSATETRKILELHQELGFHWADIARNLHNRSENDVKNRFYATLKRAATQASLEDPVRFPKDMPKDKKNLMQFFDYALKHCEKLQAPRGRKKNTYRRLAATKGFMLEKKNPNENQADQNVGFNYPISQNYSPINMQVIQYNPVVQMTSVPLIQYYSLSPTQFIIHPRLPGPPIFDQQKQ